MSPADEIAVLKREYDNHMNGRKYDAALKVLNIMKDFATMNGVELGRDDLEDLAAQMHDVRFASAATAAYTAAGVGSVDGVTAAVEYLAVYIKDTAVPNSAAQAIAKNLYRLCLEEAFKDAEKCAREDKLCTARTHLGVAREAAEMLGENIDDRVDKFVKTWAKPRE